MIIPPDYAQATIIFGGAGAPLGAAITLGFNVELYSGDPDDLALLIHQQMDANGVMDEVSEDVAVTRREVKFGPNSTGPSGEYVGSLTGAVTGNCTPPNTAFLIRKNTAFGGRTGRGRMYVPGVPEGVVTDGGAISSSVAGAMTADWEGFRTDMIAAGAPPVLLHGPGSPVSAPLPIVSFSVDTTAATQRRRLRR